MEKNQIEISIILPCFNVEEFVERTYKSICSQKGVNFEAIFVDDGSSDGTSEKLVQICDVDKRVKIIRQSNFGSGIARNTGAKASEGKYLYFMDPDDELKEGTLKVLLDEASKQNSEITICGYEEVDIVNNAIKKFNIDDAITTSKNDDVKNLYSKLVEAKLFNPPWNKLYLKKFWIENRLEFPNVKKGQDALLNILAFKSARKISVIPNKLYTYYIGRNGSAQTELSDVDFVFFEINQSYEKDLFSFWNVDHKKSAIKNKISFCFADSVKVYRYVKGRKGNILKFLKTWKNRRASSEIKNISLLQVIGEKKYFFKLLSMKIPVLNYIIQKIMIHT